MVFLLIIAMHSHFKSRFFYGFDYRKWKKICYLLWICMVFPSQHLLDWMTGRLLFILMLKMASLLNIISRNKRREAFFRQPYAEKSYLSLVNLFQKKQFFYLSQNFFLFRNRKNNNDCLCFSIWIQKTILVKMEKLLFLVQIYQAGRAPNQQTRIGSRDDSSSF